MTWANNPIVVYHGTDNLSATAITISGLDASRFNAATDFGAGFYVTPVLHQAEQWANQKVRRTPGVLNAEVLEYTLSRPIIEALSHITFITDTEDFHDLVDYCRNGNPNHGPSPRGAPYGVLYGPVSLWPQKLVIADCEQILFSDPLTLRDPDPATAMDFSAPSRRIRPRNNAKFF
jgi:Protein of unknown function (DUF3990)